MCCNCDPAQRALLSSLVTEDHGKSSPSWEAAHWSFLPHPLPQGRRTDNLIEKFKEMWFLPNMTGRGKARIWGSLEEGGVFPRLDCIGTGVWIFGNSSRLRCSLPCLEVRPFSLLYFPCHSFVVPYRQPSPGLANNVIKSTDVLALERS